MITRILYDKATGTIQQAENGAEWKKVGGGAPALVDDDGEILQGCPGLEGHNIDELDETQDERQQDQEQAEAAGWESQDQKDARQVWEQAKGSSDEEFVCLVKSGGRYFAFDEDAEVLLHVAGTGDGQVAEIDDDTADHQLQELVKSGYRVAVAETNDPTPKEATEPEHRQGLDDTHEQIGDASFDPSSFGTSDDTGSPLDEVPGQIGDAMRALSERPEAKAGNSVTVNDMHDDYAQSLHSSMQGLIHNGDGHGEVHDLSAELGHGALGYYSPHGILSIQPPRFKDDGWDVRFAQGSHGAPGENEGTQQANEAPIVPQGVPQPPQEPTEPQERRPDPFKVSPGLEETIQDLGLTDPNERAEFLGLIYDKWKPAYQNARDYNTAIDDLYGEGKVTMQHTRTDDQGKTTLHNRTVDKGRQSTISKARALRNNPNKDTSHWVGFDELLGHAQDYHPVLFNGKDDPASQLLDAIINGRTLVPKPDDEDIVAEAIAVVDRHRSQQGDQPQPDFDSSWAYRKANWATRYLDRLRYAKELNLFGDEGPEEGQTRTNRAGHPEVLQRGRWHLALQQAAPYREYGPNYNRNIADPAARLELAHKQGHNDDMLDHLGNELQSRLDHWGKPQQGTNDEPDPAEDYKQNGTRSKAFKKWFGDWENDPDNSSKVIDEETLQPAPTSETSCVTGEDGRPLVLFHGTTAGEFDRFDNPYGGWNMFSTSEKYAAQFAQQSKRARVEQYYLNIRRPFDLTHLESRRGDARNQVIRSLQRAGIDTTELETVLPFERDVYQIINGKGKVNWQGPMGKDGPIQSREILKQALSDAGYDGIKMPDSTMAVENNQPTRIEATTWIAFHPHQIKAVDNVGTFDSSDPRMRYRKIRDMIRYAQQMMMFGGDDDHYEGEQKQDPRSGNELTFHQHRWHNDAQEEPAMPQPAPEPLPEPKPHHKEGVFHGLHLGQTVRVSGYGATPFEIKGFEGTNVNVLADDDNSATTKTHYKTVMEPDHFALSESSLEKVQAKVDDLNKRAQKKKLEGGYKVEIIEPEFYQERAYQTKEGIAWIPDYSVTERHKSEKFTGSRRDIHLVQVTGTTPKYNGWQFVAKLTPLIGDDGKGSNLVKAPKGESVPKKYRDSIELCEHCNTKRKRNDTFVLKHDDGRYKAVGRNCLKDFLGYHGDASNLAAQLEWLTELHSAAEGYESEDREYNDYGASSRSYHDLNEWLPWVVSVVRQNGWKSKSKAYDEGKYDSTADIVKDLFNPPRKEADTAYQEWLKFKDQHEPTDADKVRAQTAIDWLENLSDADLDSDYLHNLNTTARAGIVNKKNWGLAASIIVAHAKAEGLEVNSGIKKDTGLNEHVGTLGKREDFGKVKVVDHKFYDGHYGQGVIIKFQDEKGRYLTWFTNADFVVDDVWPMGGEFEITATPKKHDEWNGTKQTVLTRVSPTKPKKAKTSKKNAKTLYSEFRREDYAVRYSRAIQGEAIRVAIHYARQLSLFGSDNPEDAPKPAASSTPAPKPAFKPIQGDMFGYGSPASMDPNQSRAKHTPGERQQVAGATYELTENHRWKRVDDEPETEKPEHKPTPTAPTKKITKETQKSIDRGRAMARLILQNQKGDKAKRDFESHYSSMVTHAQKLGIELPRLGTYFDPAEYKEHAQTVIDAIDKLQPTEQHVAIYNGREVPAGNFKEAAQRISDNLKAGEHGYVRDPSGKLFEVASDSRAAVPVDAMRTTEQRDIDKLKERIARSTSANEKKVLSERLAEKQADKAPQGETAGIESARKEAITRLRRANGGKKPTDSAIDAEMSSILDERINDSKNTSDIRSWIGEQRQYDEMAKNRREFVQRHPGMAAAANSMMVGDMAQVTDDVVRGRLSEDSANRLAQDALKSGIIPDGKVRQLEKLLSNHAGKTYPAAEEPEDDEPEIWHMGEQIELTGKPAEAGFETYRYLTGHKAGQEGVRATQERKDAQSQQFKDNWREQQAGFKRLRESAEKENNQPPDDGDEPGDDDHPIFGDESRKGDELERQATEAARPTSAIPKHGLHVDEAAVTNPFRDRLNAAAFSGTNKVWHYPGAKDFDLVHMQAQDQTINGQFYPAHEHAKRQSEIVKAVGKAGYKFQSKKSKYGTSVVAMKDGKILTDRGAEALLSGGLLDVEAGNSRNDALPAIQKFSDFLQALPESTQGNFGALVSAVNRSQFGDIFTLSRDTNGEITLLAKQESRRGWQISEPSGLSSNSIDSNPHRFIAKLKHMAENEIEDDGARSGWVAHDRAADRAAILQHPPTRGDVENITRQQLIDEGKHQGLANRSDGTAPKPKEQPTEPAPQPDQPPESPPEAPSEPPALSSLAARISMSLTDKGRTAILEAPASTIGHAVEQLVKVVPGANRAAIRSAIEEIRTSEGKAEPESQPEGFRIALNSEMPTLDEIREALDSVHEVGPGRWVTVDPATGERTSTQFAQIDNKNQAVAYAINHKRREFAKSQGMRTDWGMKEYKDVRGQYKSWLKSHGTSEAALTGETPTEKKAASEKAIAGSKTNLTEARQALDRMNDGDISAAELTEMYDKFVDSKAGIQAELSKMSKAELEKQFGRSFRETTKAGIVNEVYGALRDNFYQPNPDGFSWTYGEDVDAAKAKHVRGVTDEHIAAHAAGVAERREARKQRIQELKKSHDNPETLDQYREFERMRGYSELTPEQKRTYDDMVAEDARTKRLQSEQATKGTVQQISKDVGGFDLSTNHHSKRGIDIYTASPNNRVSKEDYQDMNNKAKRLGGWYYKPYQGTPGGFHFPTEDARSKFVSLLSGDLDRTADLAAEKEQKAQTTAERLTAMADSMQEQGEAVHGADRKENTDKRAREAGYAREAANTRIKNAKTLRNIASKIDSGEAHLLDGISAATHVETLEYLLRRAQQNWSDHTAKASGKDSYTERENLKSQPYSEDMIDHVKYPYPGIHKNYLDEIETKLKGKRGIRSSSNAITAQKDDDEQKSWVELRSPVQWESLSEVIQKLKDVDPAGSKHLIANLSDAAADHRRLHKMGITSPHALRAALRQYLPLRGEGKQEDPRKKADRALIGKKIEGFFPTPPSLIDRMLSQARVEDGHDILEPSAGKGDIMDAIANEAPGANLKGLEINRAMQPSLDARGHDVDYGDFLEHQGQYDRILMNPPFENNQDIDHVRHAHSLLKPGGRLVAIMGAGSLTGSRSKPKEFVQWLNDIGAEYEQLPADSFSGTDAFRTTGVNTYIVTIDK